jgi:hypothetical protein
VPLKSCAGTILLYRLVTIVTIVLAWCSWEQTSLRVRQLLRLSHLGRLESVVATGDETWKGTGLRASSHVAAQLADTGQTRSHLQLATALELRLYLNSTST